MRELTRELFHAFMSQLPTHIAVRLHYAIHHKRFPNTRNPARFSEKIIFRKLFDRDQTLADRVDKIAVKAFVSNKIGAEYVTPTIWSGQSLPERSKRTWPIPYVMKSNNGSSTNYFVRSDEDVHWDHIERLCNKLLSATHASWTGEWLYTKIQPKLLVEPFISLASNLPLDYKLFVFGGRVEYIEVDTDRENDHKRTFFDRTWTRQEFSLGYKRDDRDIPPPTSLTEMIEAAEKLSDGIPFVRIDFYEIDGRPVFGEMTFYPDAGIAKFTPDLYDFKLGNLWK